MVFQVAAGILVAAFVLAIIALGIAIVTDRDAQARGQETPGMLIAVTGFVVGLVVIYFGWS